MARTNVVLDGKLLREAMELTGIGTKRALLDEALRVLVQVRKQERIWELFGTVDWDGDLAEMRRSRFDDGDR
ncbi:MAG: type II toxin-antitoxin system VapB family antitoxin [Armatimonadetes bacterium]|nr:type II toxin-antitoxin system VapB family antitoxin [Armatimonadota bacterium]